MVDEQGDGGETVAFQAVQVLRREGLASAASLLTDGQGESREKGQGREAHRTDTSM